MSGRLQWRKHVQCVYDTVCWHACDSQPNLIFENDSVCLVTLYILMLNTLPTQHAHGDVTGMYLWSLLSHGHCNIVYHWTVVYYDPWVTNVSLLNRNVMSSFATGLFREITACPHCSWDDLWSNFNLWYNQHLVRTCLFGRRCSFWGANWLAEYDSYNIFYVYINIGNGYETARFQQDGSCQQKWPLDNLKCDIRARFKSWQIQHIPWHRSEVYTTKSYWWYVNAGSGNGVMLSFGSKLLPQPMLI